jgi:hypothetical protein
MKQNLGGVQDGFYDSFTCLEMINHWFVFVIVDYHNLHRKLTKGIMFWDWKTKWSDYDLRISISAPKHLQDLAGWIEHGFYSDGRQKELVEQIKALDPDASIIWGSVERFEKQLEELEETFNLKEND